MNSLARTAFVSTIAALLFGCAPGYSQISIGAGADYPSRLAAWHAAHDPYEQTAEAYWEDVAAKRRVRNAKRRTHERIALDDYVLDHPPVYDGPPRPLDPNAPPGPQPGERAPIPLIADFLRNAQMQFGFVPDLPRNDLAFKRAYARVAQAGGLRHTGIGALEGEIVARQVGHEAELHLRVAQEIGDQRDRRSLARLGSWRRIGIERTGRAVIDRRMVEHIIVESDPLVRAPLGVADAALGGDVFPIGFGRLFVRVVRGVPGGEPRRVVGAGAD